MFRDIGGELIPGHDGEVDLLSVQRVENISPALEHMAEDPSRFQEGGIRHFFRTENQEPVGDELFLVEVCAGGGTHAVN